ncbi:hypothetical protein [Microcoleus sp. bin48.metabat.b7b8b9.023]|uniref:hypothetical protein n=1 Tax=Microcoleus sp. bin48.metabat.b7b8b9.023 TaxID=2742710 RepID=UPI0025EB69EF|nr:hypothetical protein [Microcoleus sp. bin48.metabat.b7b8b9.023]
MRSERSLNLGSDRFAVNCQLSTVNCQLSTVNCQLSTVNCLNRLTNGERRQ